MGEFSFHGEFSKTMGDLENLYYIGNSQVRNFWGCSCMWWVTGREDVSDKIGGVVHGKVLTFGGVEV